MGDCTNKPYEFKCLNFKGYWRIIWVGRLSRLSNSSDSVSIYVSAGKLTGSEKYSHSIPLEYKRANLPIGEFPSLYIGAVLKDGDLIPPEELPNHFHQIHDFDLNLSKADAHAFTRTTKDDAECLVPMGHQWDFYKEPQADSCLLGIRYNNNPYGIAQKCCDSFTVIHPTLQRS
jgi:hypothetical protein